MPTTIYTINRDKFFSKIRPLFGTLSTNQVAGIETILTEWDKRGLTDLRWLSYMLATTFHETAKTMQPIAEYGKGRGKEYGKPVNGKIYFGRGYVQLTWLTNYYRFCKLLNVDLVNNPDLAMQPDTAVKIMFEGMIKGLFTGKKLSDYFNDHSNDPVQARRIINILDQAKLIAGYYAHFLEALT